MDYTKPMTWNQLKAAVGLVAHELKTKMEVWDRTTGDGKVTSEIQLPLLGATVRFYDYKATNQYADGQPTITALRRSKYAYHVQFSSETTRILLTPHLYFLEGAE